MLYSAICCCVLDWTSRTAWRVASSWATLNERCRGLWLKYPVAVEKEAKAVISANFSTYGERTFNNLRTNFVTKNP